MIEIKLDAHIVDGNIELSEEQRQALTSIKDGSAVEIVVRSEDSELNDQHQSRNIFQEMADQGFSSIIDYLIVNPLKVEGEKPLNREEIYSDKRYK